MVAQSARWLESAARPGERGDQIANLQLLDPISSRAVRIPGLADHWDWSRMRRNGASDHPAVPFSQAKFIAAMPFRAEWVFAARRMGGAG